MDRHHGPPRPAPLGQRELIHPGPPQGSSSATRTPSESEASPDPIAALIAAVGRAGEPAPAGPLHEVAGLRAPLWRLALTSPFGPRIHPVLGTLSDHLGNDYGARAGTPVRAAAYGTVVWAGELGPYGNLVVIEHPAGLHTAYGHLASTSVTAGRTVLRGQRIGRVGATGRATGPDLHLEVRVEGVAVDPTPWLTEALPTGVAATDAVRARLAAR